MEHLSSDGVTPREFVLQEITKKRLIADPNEFDLEEARQQRLDWWAKKRAANK
jgi:hypothetical protein